MLELAIYLFIVVTTTVKNGITEIIRITLFIKLDIIPVDIFGNINLSLFTRCFCSTCKIHCVTIKAISRHSLTNYSCDDFS